MHRRVAPSCHCWRIVRAAVVNHDDLCWPNRLMEHTVQGLADERRSVVCGDHGGDGARTHDCPDGDCKDRSPRIKSRLTLTFQAAGAVAATAAEQGSCT